VDNPVLLQKPELAAGVDLRFLELTLEEMHAIPDFIKQERLPTSWWSLSDTVDDTRQGPRFRGPFSLAKFDLGQLP